MLIQLADNWWVNPIHITMIKDDKQPFHGIVTQVYLVDGTIMNIDLPLSEVADIINLALKDTEGE